MKVKTSELSGKALDYAVAKCEGGTDFAFDGIAWGFRLDGRTKVLAKGWADSMMFCPSTEWGHGGPIVDRADIHIRGIVGGYAAWTKKTVPRLLTGPTMLVAAMRAHVFAELGGEVEVPDFLE